ncbi:MAG: BPL-N domain-containing protein [Phycisphaerae bacterium]
MKTRSMADIAVYHGRKSISGESVVKALRRLRIGFKMVTARDIARGKLGRFAAVIFPGGNSIQLDPKSLAAAKAFIRSGGGMVGVCAGAQFGAAERLLNVRHHILRGNGILDMRVVARGPITRGYAVAGPHRNRRTWKYSNRGRVRIRYANGGFCDVGRGVRTFVSMDEEGRMGTIVAGRYGRGRVVLITPHPESTPPPEMKRGINSDKSQDPLGLFANAVRWAAVIQH